MNKNLKELTDDTIKEVLKLDVVLPETYSEFFHKLAQKKGVEIDQEDLSTAITDAYERIQKISNETQLSAVELKDNISKAKVAVVEQDNATLSGIETNLIALEEKIKKLQLEIYTDSLTGIYNRKWFYEKFLDDGYFRTNGSLAFIDVNSFKLINDTYGHNNGDKVLIIIAKVLSKIDGAQIIRLAGDEFIVISKAYNKETLSLLLDAVCNNLKKTPLKSGGEQFFVSFSYGASDFKKSQPFNDVYVKTDELMYKAKEAFKASQKS